MMMKWWLAIKLIQFKDSIVDTILQLNCPQNNLK